MTTSVGQNWWRQKFVVEVSPSGGGYNNKNEDDYGEVMPSNRGLKNLIPFLYIAVVVGGGQFHFLSRGNATEF